MPIGFQAGVFKGHARPDGFTKTDWISIGDLVVADNVPLIFFKLNFCEYAVTDFPKGPYFIADSYDIIVCKVYGVAGDAISQEVSK